VAGLEAGDVESGASEFVGAELAGVEFCAHIPTLQARIKTKSKLRIKLFYRTCMT
jgi:hypothetical protein